MQLELFSVWAVLATALLIAGAVRWRRGRPMLGVAAAWLATPLWSIGFGLVFIALAMTVLASIAAAASRPPRARIAA